MNSSERSEHLFTEGRAWLAAGLAEHGSFGTRALSLDRFRQLGLPSRKDESWRYLPLKRVFGKDLAPNPGPEAEPLDPRLKSEIDSLGFAHRLVFLDGGYSAALSSPEALPTGVHLLCGPAASADAWAAERRAARAGVENQGLTALSSALAREDLLLRISSPHPVDLALIHLTSASGEAPAVFGELRVHLTAGANASLAQVFLSSSESRALASHQTLVTVDEGGSLTESRAVLGGPDSSLLLRSEVELGRGARFTGHQLLLRGGVSRSELQVNLGEAAEVALGGLALASGTSHAEHDVLVHHRGPRAKSQQLYKTIADGSGHTAFHGRVIVDESAGGAVAHQVNRNLLLSREAEVDTRPQLEIYAKEVEASHGATVGQLDEEQLFFLASRGIDGDAARAMLRAAFVEEALAAISPEPLQAWSRAAAFAALGVSPELAGVSGGSLDVG